MISAIKKTQNRGRCQKDVVSAMGEGAGLDEGR